MDAVERYQQFKLDNEVDRVEWPLNVDVPAGIPPAHDVANTLLHEYCRFLNHWIKTNDGDIDYTYSPVSFYHRKLVAVYETYYWVVVLEVYDGDEGSITVLTGMFTVPLTRFDGTLDPPELRYLLQEFDTVIQFLIEDGKPKEWK